MSQKLLLLLKQSISSLTGSVVDLGVFYLVYWLCRNLEETTAIFIATIFARIISGIVNFILSRNMVFKNKDNMAKTFPKYVIANIVQMLLSALFVSIITKYTNMNVTITKCIVDFGLFFAFFYVSKHWIFKNAN